VRDKPNRLGVGDGRKDDTKEQQGGFKHTGYGFTLYYERFFDVLIAVFAKILARITGYPQTDGNKKALI